jgi:hypothetical protein
MNSYRLKAELQTRFHCFRASPCDMNDSSALHFVKAGCSAGGEEYSTNLKGIQDEEYSTNLKGIQDRSLT